MLNFKSFYRVISGLLLLSQLLILSILIYNQYKYGMVIYFGNKNEPNAGFEKYFITLQLLLYSTFVLMTIWAIITPIAVISNRRLERDKIKITIGVIGFLTAMVLLIVDPFGIFKWVTSAG